MPTIKISQLTEKPTMAGTEEVLINDSGTSKKFSTQRFLDVKTATETARDAALTAQTAAETAETNAETAETNASGSATAAATSETNAASSASAASTSASNASTSATSASGSATAAAASAAAAASTYDSFDDRYLGVKASDPTTDNDGDALVQGMLYFDSVNSLMKVYDGSSWITTSSATLATLDTYKFTATSGQTVFTGTDDDGGTLAIKPTAEMVTLNGIVLESGTDYTVTATTLTLTTGATLDDEVNVYAFGNFELADHYNKAASDARYLQSVAANSIGATELNVTGNGTSGQYLGSDADGSFTWTSISADPTMGGDLSGTASNAQIGANTVTDTELNSAKVNGIEANANNYSHPATHPASMLTGALPAIDGSALTGVQPFPSGTKMVFAQASAPTGWTQDTTNNDKALRVVSGTGGGTGGTHGLSSPPSTSHTHTGPSHTHSTPAHSHSHTLSAGAHTLSTSEMPSHNHSMTVQPTWGSGNYIAWGGNGGTSSKSTNTSGGGSSHSHSLSGSITSGGSGTSGSGGTGATSSAGPTAFAPQYVDVIVCSKD